MPEASAEAPVVRSWLTLIADLPWEQHTDDALDVGAAQAQLDADHHGLAKVKTRIVFGEPVSAILQTLEEGHYDLVVLSTHGRTGFSHLLMGSVAERIVRRSPVPVLTLRTGTPAMQTTAPARAWR